MTQTIIQVPIDYKDKSSFYQNETLASLIAECVFNKFTRENTVIRIYTNMPRYWADIGMPIIRLFSKYRDIIIVDISKESETYKEQPFCLKCNMLTRGFKDALGDESELAIYMDGDLTTVNSWRTDITKLYAKTNFDIAMAHECGLTNLLPYPNYNSGLIVAGLTTKFFYFLENWTSITEQEIRRKKVVLDQDTMVKALEIANPHILTLPSVYNLRCHEVYNHGADVWSPVYLVHSHIASKLITKLITYAIKYRLTEANAVDMIKKGLISLNDIVNDAQFPHKPRRVQITTETIHKIIIDLITSSRE